MNWSTFIHDKLQIIVPNIGQCIYNKRLQGLSQKSTDNVGCATNTMGSVHDGFLCKVSSMVSIEACFLNEKRKEIKFYIS